ncbi:MAG: sulfurtransferase TusA family protein [Actinomycetia bacterium]|nr:sulfurtransferase TusA family protein [Actinomycetes bacterium]
MADVLDLRGLSCPLPVVETRKKIKGATPGEPFEVLVETGTSRDNVTRMATREGCEVTVTTKETEAEEEYLLTITRR